MRCNPSFLKGGFVSHPNFVVASFSTEARARLLPHLAVIRLESGDVLAETHERIRRVYFPHSGILSCVVDLLGGGAIETGMIGRDGVFGGSQALNSNISLNRVMVQVNGEASVIDPDKLRGLALELPEIREALVQHEQFFLAQVQQTAACNAAHKVRQRLARWLIRMHELSGPNLELTQEFLAQMMGVSRPSVTDVARELQAAGLISYRRGHIQILDINKVTEWACECEQDMAEHRRQLFRDKTS